MCKCRSTVVTKQLMCAFIVTVVNQQMKIHVQTSLFKANQQGKRYRNRVITISKCKFNQYETNTDVFLAIIKTTLQDFFNSRV